MTIQQQEIPYKTIIVIALITVPLFGIFGAVPMPALFSGHASFFVRFTRGEVWHSFLTIAATILVLWGLNTLLLYLFTRYVVPRFGWLRIVLSVLFFGLIGFLLLHNFRMHRLPKHNFPPMFRPVYGVYGERHLGFPPAPGIMHDRIGFFFFPLLQAQAVNVIILILLDIIVLRSKKARTEKENDSLRMANLEAKHNLLKQQLQPHFLFNSLTIVKALIKKDPLKADAYINRLSELLRYSVYSINQFTVPVAEELGHVNNYIEMQNLRFGDALKFSTDMPSQLLHSSLPVYSIQLLVENALKHNIFTAAQPLFIKVTGDIKTKTITIENNLQPKRDAGGTEGVGLQNLSERYQLLQGEAIVIEKTTDLFRVTLKVLDNASSDH
ncbi:hypothetical protein A8C56_19915 [Niabella ginsenosidivorans]|uniref:Signal transduction histidine kinase internal region domain-containing protein n=2 Tax=Niabella ginsenosidivorans TaxID=1176587 RepID=A0A1A9I8G5_9BACT|nr:hypothetical protein A8C56_19915 [Niabella ginsenosidivorans]